MQLKKWLLLIIFGILIVSGCTFLHIESMLVLEIERYEWETVEFELFQRIMVKIHNKKTKKIGTGLIVKIVDDKAYIITVVDLVKGNMHPTVELFHHSSKHAKVILTYNFNSTLLNLTL